MKKQQGVLLPAAALGVAAAAPAARAQSWPSKPLSLVVAFSAGGPTDTLARITAERMRRALGQTVVVDNIVGASGTLGVGRVARAAPDGYQLILGHWGTHVLSGAVHSTTGEVKALLPAGEGSG